MSTLENSQVREATDRLIEALGGIRATARILGVAPSAAHRWKRRGYVTAEYVLRAEEACEARVTRYELRPDIYPR